MAETSYLWDNPGTGDSPALGYGNALLNQIIFRMITNGTGDQGVLRTWLNDLEVTDGGVDTADVDTGGAMLYGVWYESDAVENININAYRGGNCLIVVRAVWATQTAQIVARVVGALTQNPGVTYEIPLANIAINGAGAITLITDTRDYCEFSSDIWPFTVTSDHLAADAVTIAKLIDQDRELSRGAGTLEPDATSPAAWVSNLTPDEPHDTWSFVDAAASYLWCTFRIPADFTGANITIGISPYRNGNAAGDVRWLYNAYIAAAGGALALTGGATVQVITFGGSTYGYVPEFDLCTLAVNAGDIVHFQIGRDGGHGADTLTESMFLILLRAYYTADS